MELKRELVVISLNETPETQLRLVIDEIERHNELYHGKGTTEISDAEYDALVAEARLLIDDCEEDSDVVKEAKEILSSVGHEPSYGKKIEHEIRMGSLNKVHDSIEDLQKWASKYNNAIIATPKVDGLAVRLVYEDGKLIFAATRGDGKIGQDVTDNFRGVSAPKNIPISGSVEVRGEVYMSKENFAILREEGLEFANPRNAAAGSLMQKDASKTAERKLSFIAYDILDEQAETYERRYDDLGRLGFETVPYILILDNSGLEQAVTYFTNKRTKYPYQTDGIVFSVNDVNTVEEEGDSGGKPYAKMAFKFPPEKATSQVTAINWQAGRTGRITPVVEIIPTRLDGSVITNMSIHNISELRRKDVCVGDTIEFIKAGDIIPQVCKVIEKSKDPQRMISVPMKCPACGGDSVDNGTELLCLNDACYAKAERRILHYITTLDIKGVGVGVVRTMLKHGLIDDIPSLYKINVNDLAKLPGWGMKSAKEVALAILGKNQIPLDLFIASLGIDGIGKRAGAALADKFKTLQAVRQAKASSVSSMEGFGDITAKKFVEGMQTYAYMIDELSQIVEIAEVKEINGVLSGKSFCVTGTLSKKRKEVQEDIKNAGGTIHSSVKKDTTYLVAGDNVGANKTDKARKYGVEVIDEEQLKELLK